MMNTAWIVPVWRPDREFGRILVAYVAAFDDADTARQAVMEKLDGAEGVEVKEAALIGADTVMALKLAQGQIYQL